MIVYIFIDGIGFGENNPENNPFAKFAKSLFLPLADQKISSLDSKLQDLVYLETDASLGVEGLPQSATGQTALWTGLNAPMILGRHISGFPTITLKKIIEQYSIIKILNEHGKKAQVLNCYTPKYFQMTSKKKRFISASTLVQLAGGGRLNTLEDLKNGDGIFMDITQEYLIQIMKDDWEHTFSVRDPFDVGRDIILQTRKKLDFSIFEYFLTDKVGHDQDWKLAEKIIGHLEDFLYGIISSMDPNQDQLIITSDHGNLEDLSTSTHTMNKVPTILYGNHSEYLKNSIQNLTDIPRSIYEIFKIQVDFNNFMRS